MNSIKTLKWFAINGLVAIAVYFGFFVGIEGAKNVSLAIIWATIALSPFLLSGEAINHHKGKSRSVPAWLNIAFYLCIIFVLAWYAMFVTASFYFVSLLIQEKFWLEVAKTENRL